MRNSLLSRPPQNFERRQYRAQFEPTAAARTDVVTTGFDIGYGQIDSESVAQFDQATNPIQRDGTVGIHETVVTDFHKAGGQDMLEEAADELYNIEGKDSWALAVGFAIANEHGAVMDFDDARVGDGDFEDVRSQVFEASFAGGYRLRVDVPVDVLDFGRDLT